MTTLRLVWLIFTRLCRVVLLAVAVVSMFLQHWSVAAACIGFVLLGEVTDLSKERAS